VILVLVYIPTEDEWERVIYEIEKLYGNILTNSSKDNKKQLILDYAPKLLVINVGDLSCDNDVYTSLALEQVLISLFNSKYNK